jgi:hypothetical protein
MISGPAKAAFWHNEPEQGVVSSTAALRNNSAFPIKGEIGMREENAFLQQFKPPVDATCGGFSKARG